MRHGTRRRMTPRSLWLTLRAALQRRALWAGAGPAMPRPVRIYDVRYTRHGTEIVRWRDARLLAALQTERATYEEMARAPAGHDPGAGGSVA